MSAETSPEHEPTPIIATFTLGPYETNCYVVSIPGGEACWIIDASFEPDELIEYVRARSLRPEALVLTHAHLDHIAGVHDVLKAFPRTPIWIHERERDWLGDPELNLSAYVMPVTAPPADRLLHDDEMVQLGASTWRVLHTPGHSPGGITLYHSASATAFVGDALFAGSIGRTDFPGCSFETLARSIRTRLYSLPESTRVLAGHGPETTIGREKRHNSFVRA